ncbi:MAG: hypothetical protein JSV79_01765 [Armatimonadota bacterium]|nr:MAG: hypothetical protein JSV79_01765 [Armatimonadota bacterium]
MSEDQLREVVSALRESRKYRFVCEDTLRRIAGWAAARHTRTKDIVKAAKRKLHQAYGAYLEGFDPAEVRELVDGLPSDPPADALRETCLTILGRHASTRERMAFMEQAYAEVFRRTGRPKVILDLACGLNPFAFPRMGVSKSVRYHACDIDSRIMLAVDAFFVRVGVDHDAVWGDVLVSAPEVDADVAFLLKTVPCLERQEKSAAVRVLREIRARHVVVSFPAQSLGGRDKGMHEHYAKEMKEIADELGVSADELAYPSETFYLLTKT